MMRIAISDRERRPAVEAIEPRRLLSATLPDLYVQSFETSPIVPDVEVGRTYRLYFPVRNANHAAAGASTLRFYLSLTPAPGDGARLLATVPVPAVEASSQHMVRFDVTIPADLVIGSAYYPVAVVDADGAVAESDEADNVTTGTALAIRAQSTTDTSTFSAGGATLTAGADDSGSLFGIFPLAPGYAAHGVVIVQDLDRVSQVPARLHLSSDSVAGNGDDVLVADGLTVTRYLGSSTGAAEVSMVLPAGIAPGAYRVVAVFEGADGPRALLGDAVTLTAPPAGVDLDVVTNEIHAIHAPVPAGSLINVAVDLANRGGAASGPFAVTMYLSADDAPDASDVLVASVAVPDGLAGVSLDDLFGIRAILPADLTPGSYRAYVVLDEAGATADVDRTNNVVWDGPLVVTAPGVTVAASAPARVPIGSAFAATVTLRNRTSAAVRRDYTVQTYLSADRFYSDDDVNIGQRNLTAAIKARSGVTATVRTTIPAATPAGTRYLITVTDDGAGTTLAGVTPLRVTAPQLSAKLISVTPLARAKATLVTVRVRNAGSAASTSPVTFSLFDEEARVFSAERTLNLPPGKSVLLTFRVGKLLKAFGLSARV